MFEETREYLKKIGMPQGDAYDMPSSELRFPDGAAFRTEVPTVNTAEAAWCIAGNSRRKMVSLSIA